LKAEIARLESEAGIPASARKREGQRASWYSPTGTVCRESPDGPTMTLPAVCRRLRVSRFTVWRMTKRGEFPPPLKADKRCAVWRALDVNAWCRANAAHFERVIARRLPAALYR